jgi:hypothetical protein
VTPKQIEDLKEFARRIARLIPEQVENRKWEKWFEKLRRREDPLAWETQEDSVEDQENLYR